LTYDIIDFPSFNFKSECFPAVKEEETDSIAVDSLAIAVTYTYLYSFSVVNSLERGLALVLVLSSEKSQPRRGGLVSFSFLIDIDL